MQRSKIFPVFAFLWCFASIGHAQVEGTDKASGEGAPAIYVVTEVPPKFPGGEYALLNYLSEQTTYPEKSRERGEQGVVMVQFVINEDGSVSNATVLKSVSRLLDAEAIRVVESMPRWEPGYNRGKAVKVYYKLPMRFMLDGVEE